MLAIGRLRGANAIAAVSRSNPGRIYAARKGSAGGIVIGYGEGEMFIASDLPALLPHTTSVYHLEDGDIATVDAEGMTIKRPAEGTFQPTPLQVDLDPVAIARGPYRHFMLKEIHEQPRALSDTIRGRARLDPPSALADDLSISDETLRGIERVLVIGMGTSLHAAMIGRWWIEQIAGIPADFDNASEFRFRAPLLGPSTLVVSVTQSGETDRHAGCHEPGARVLGRTTDRGHECGRLRSHSQGGRIHSHPLRGRKSASPRPRPSPAPSLLSTCSPADWGERAARWPNPISPTPWSSC